MKKITATDRALVAHRAKVLAYSAVDYVFGGNTVHGFDCSWLSQQAWAGVRDLEHNTVLQRQQLGAVPPTEKNLARLLPGDLIWFPGEDSQGGPGTFDAPQHVAVYVETIGGLRLMAQATMPGIRSEVIRLNKYGWPIGISLVEHT